MTALIIVAIFIASAALFGLGVLLAPEGYQDELGFHYGRPPVR